jgi:ABC-type transporter Mla subunit MlaD
MEKLYKGLGIVVKVGHLGLVLVGIWFLISVHRRLDQVDKLLDKTNDTLYTVVKTSESFALTARSIQEQLDDQETVEARKMAQVRLTESLEHVARVTLPRADKVLDQVAISGKSFDQMIGETSSSLNQSLIPAMTQTILTSELEMKELGSKIRDTSDQISKQYLADSHEVAATLNQLLASGQISIESLNKQSQELTQNLNSVLVNSGEITHNLSEATGELPAMAKHARKWQPIFTGSRLVALLLGIFNP